VAKMARLASRVGKPVRGIISMEFARWLPPGG